MIENTENVKKNLLKIMHSLVPRLKFKKVSEAFDRGYIQYYIDFCRDRNLITGKILEWGGSNILYSNPEVEDVTICTGMKDQAPDATVHFDILPVPALKNMKKLLRENGKLIVTISGPCYRDRDSEGFKTFWTERGLRDLCKEVFEKEEIRNIVVYGTFSGAINALLGLKHDNTKNTRRTDFNVITGVTCIKKKGEK